MLNITKNEWLKWATFKFQGTEMNTLALNCFQCKLKAACLQQSTSQFLRRDRVSNFDFKIDALVEIQKICFSQSFNECMFWCFFFCSFNGYTE